MAFNRDFSNVNQAIQRMMSFYLQNKLGELSNERYMDTIAEQDRLMRERSAQEDVLARGRAKESYGMDFNLAIQKGIISAINDPALDGLRKQAQLFEMAGDTERAKQAKEAFASKVPGYINAAYVANTGKRPLSEDEIMNALMATDTESLMTLIKEGGVNRRFEQELPIQKQQASTSAGNLELGQKQFEADQGKPGATNVKALSTAITDAMNFLEPVARGDNPMTMMYSAPASYMNKQLSEIQMKVINGEEVTDADKQTINEARDLRTMIGKYKTGKLRGQPGYQAGMLEDKVNKSLIDNPITTPPATATETPTAQGRVEQTAIGPVAIGEIRVSPKDGKQYRYMGNNQWQPAQ